jgi:hypothetical protein
MKFKDMMALFASFSAVAGLAFSSTGCSKNENISDEFARISSQEVSNMDANSSTMLTAPSGIPKLAATAADTVYYDWNIHPYAWDTNTVTGDTFLVRTATLTCSDGYERVRVDTVTFYDDNHNTLRHPTLATVDSIHHVRHVTRDKGGHELDLVVDMHSSVRSIGGNDYTHVKNGTIVGTFDGEQCATGTITDVTRNYVSGHWQLWPVSGSITADFPRRKYEVDFLGLGLVRLTITNKATDKTKVITISVDQQ